ncbi:hypothetical protein PICMEDRAFT_16786 [Pichia membranifaciens NRRL Y-2026]|uniref:BIR-domain-containing protein n=1 Tax=Pichia membranifaciens NRRL Y-2026 TaxID=763406 RepID=A0A1E3NLJ1_9ASCO|nr:hypothetical protein PICMEDRAFT_16786 [Pichia membranifaciens NRRL Y-2026]ODQ46991.1 hypothetical protein PICMEDRAFT_16786 [Pichia membranifaciens NRRL Y-2026]
MPAQRRARGARAKDKSHLCNKSKVNPAPQAPQSFTSRLDTFHQVHMINDEPVSYQNTASESLVPLELRPSRLGRQFSERLVTRSEIHHRSLNLMTLQSPQWLAQVGFYYTPLSIKHQFAITCTSCNEIIRDPVPLETDISAYHLAENSMCALSAVWKFRNIINDSLRSKDMSWQQDAVFGHVSSERGTQIRRETFKWWKHRNPDVESMASSGLYYDPYVDQNEVDGNVCGDDRVICMYCGLRLEQWEEEDDPLSVHQKEMPSCWVFNFDKPVTEKEIGLDNDQRLMIESGEYNAQEDVPDYEGNPLNEDHDIEFISSDKEDAPTVISLATATTTTTNTALPVEILDQDEVEEFLSNSQGRHREENNRLVDIPSMKSSDLSQFFTELDAESESEVGASFFANNRRRREREKEQKENVIANVEPIAEESLMSTEEGKVNNEEEKVQQKEEDLSEQIRGVDKNGMENDLLANEADPQLEPEIQPAQELEIGLEIPIYENDDFAFENNDAHKSTMNEAAADSVETENNKLFNNPVDSFQHKSEKDQENKHRMSEQDKPRREKMGAVSIQDKENEISNRLFSEPTEAGESIKETRDADDSRVKHLESELKQLRMQIEALQNSQNLQLQAPTENASYKVNTNPARVHDADNFADENTSTPIQLRDKESEAHATTTEPANLLLSPELTVKRNSHGPLRDDEIVVSSVKQEENTDSEHVEVTAKKKKRKKTRKIKSNHSKSKHTLHEREEAGIRKEDVDDNKDEEEEREEDNNDERQKKRMKKNHEEEREKYKESEVHKVKQTVITVSDDPLSFKLDSRKKSKKHENKNKRQKAEISDKVEIKQEPDMGQELSIQMESGTELKMKTEQTPEIPTEADQIVGTSSLADEANNDHSELLVGNAVLTYSQPDEQLRSNTNEDKQEESPTLMRKKARSPPVTEAIPSEAQESRFDTLNALMNAGRPKSDRLNELPEENHFFIESDIMMKNQSTPYANDTKTVDMSEKFSKKPTDEADGTEHDTDCRRQLSLDEKEEKTKWVPIDSNKYREFYKDIQEATGYVKEVLDSRYELLGDDLEGLLTEFIAEIPPEQLKMTVREWIRFQEEQAVGLVLDKAELMMEQFRKDQSTAIRFLADLPEGL